MELPNLIQGDKEGGKQKQKQIIPPQATQTSGKRKTYDQLVRL